MYMSMLETYNETFRQLLLFVIQNPGEPFLVHCTAGKDRAGVGIAMLLSLAGVPRQAIAHDYALSRLGIERARDFLLEKVVSGRRELDWNDPRLRAIAGSE